jgi:hypothetical protein
MPDFASSIRKHHNLSDDDLKKAGQAIAGKMGKKHEDFLKVLLNLLSSKEIDPADPETFLKQEVYDALDNDWKAKVDLALINIAQQIELIADFFHSTKTPNESPHLETMIEHLWDMKQRIEDQHDVFKF